MIMKASKINIILLLTAFIIGALLLMNIIRAPEKTYLWRAVFNAGHIPLFGIIALALLGISSRLLTPVIKRRSIHYVVAFLAAAGVGLITEIIQYYSPRDADFNDLIRDAVGAAIFLVFYMTYDRRFIFTSNKALKKLKIALRIAAVAVFMAALIPAGQLALAYYYRQAQLPAICGFDSRWEMMFARGENAQLDLATPPPGWNDSTNNMVARLTFHKAAYPGLVIEEPFPDWTDYSAFSFEIFSPYDSIIALSLRINDSRHNYRFEDRFNVELDIYPGRHEFVIPVEAIKNGPVSREMDMTSIRMIKLFAHRPDTEFALYIDNFKLIEGDISDYIDQDKNHRVRIEP